MQSSASADSKPSPVVITTVLNRKASQDKETKGPPSAAAPSASSAASVDSNSQAEGAGGGGGGNTTSADRNSLRTIAQQRPPSSSGKGFSAGAGTAANPSGDASANATATAGSGGFGVPPNLTIDTDEFAVRVPAQGSSVRSELSRGLSPTGSQGSSVVTRVYAPSSVDDQVTFSRGGASWAMEVGDGREGESKQRWSIGREVFWVAAW